MKQLNQHKALIVLANQASKDPNLSTKDRAIIASDIIFGPHTPKSLDALAMTLAYCIAELASRHKDTGESLEAQIGKAESVIDDVLRTTYKSLRTDDGALDPALKELIASMRNRAHFASHDEAEKQAKIIAESTQLH